jgi:uncharacterized protein YndB with AHSA1/START domain
MAENHSVRLHRVLKAPPEKVCRAFITPDAMARWLAPNGYTARAHHMDPRIGETFRITFTRFTTNKAHSFGGEYPALVQNELVRDADRFDDPNLPGTMLVTVTQKPVSCGTELHVVQEGLPDVIPLDLCYLLAGVPGAAGRAGHS